MLAFTLIPGLCAFAHAEPLELTRRPLARDCFAYLLSLILLLRLIGNSHTYTIP